MRCSVARDTVSTKGKREHVRLSYIIHEMPRRTGFKRQSVGRVLNEQKRKRMKKKRCKKNRMKKDVNWDLLAARLGSDL